MQVNQQFKAAGLGLAVTEKKMRSGKKQRYDPPDSRSQALGLDATKPCSRDTNFTNRCSRCEAGMFSIAYVLVHFLG
jgi:hypothetical protein